MRKRTGIVLVGIMASVFVASALADAAFRCHPDPAGTRAFTLRADVTGYRFSGDRVIVDWSRSPTCAGTTVWEYGAKARSTASLSCGSRVGTKAAGTSSKLVASDAVHVVRVVPAPAGVDLPDRLLVMDRATHRRVASWPLIDLPDRVAVHGDIAILSAAKRHALYALRLSDGRIRMIGIARPGDRPVIGAAGVLYQDDLDLSRHVTAPAERTLKLLPLATVRDELSQPLDTATGMEIVGPLRTNPVTAISMDGPRVALAVHDPSGQCDKVLFWNVAWHFVSRLTRSSGPTCLPTHAPGGITDVAIAGSRAIWTTTYGSSTRLLAANIIACEEWVVARPVPGAELVAGLSGDGSLLAYAFRGSSGPVRHVASVGIVPKLWRGDQIVSPRGQVTAVSAASGQLAILQDSGRVSLVAGNGRRMGSFDVGAARAISLRPGALTVLTKRGTLDVYATATGRRLHSWKAPAGAGSLDLHYGIALLTAGRDVFAVNVHTGRTVRLVHAPAPVSAQLEAPGAAVQYNAQGHGYLRFLPMSWIEDRTR